MNQSKLNVKLIEHTPNPEKVIAMAGKLCYSPSDIDTLQEGLTQEQCNKFVNMLMSMGHESPVEHVSFTFAIEGISRITEQQLTRHRVASYSIQSGRYVKRNNLNYIIPPKIENNALAKDIFLKAIEVEEKAYNALIGILIEDGRTEKQAIEDARYVYPQGLSTRIICTMNVRELFNLFKHRCCSRSQWEIRYLANEMLKQCKQVAPTLFKYAGASCIMNGYCPEGKMSCGAYPTLEEIKDMNK